VQSLTNWLVFIFALATLTGCSVASKCANGSVSCGGVCVETQADNLNCGVCGNICAVGTACSNGACAVPCQSGQVACDGACIDPQTSPTYCGASGTCTGTQAGTACTSGQTCQGGTCACPVSGQVACGGACIDPRTSATYCGASGTCTGTQAGTACTSGQTCQGGTCACPVSGQVTCGGACIDPQTSLTYCGASGDCSGTQAGTACAPGQACQGGTCAQECRSVALDLDTPFAAEIPPFASVHGQQTPTAFWGSLAAPRPTNTSWENMVVGPGQNRVDFLPYQVKAVPEGLAISQAAPTTNTSSEILVPDLKQVVLGSLEAFTGHVVEAYDLFSVRLRYSASGGTMTVPLVYGMPYVTADYSGLRPFLIPGTYAISSVNGSTLPGLVSGTRFQLALSDGSTWVVYTSAPITFAWTSGSLAAQASFAGTVRVAVLPTPAAAAVLDAHRDAVPRGGRLAISVACDQATVSFVYTTTGTGTLLLAAMPHQLARMVAPTVTSLTFPTLTGSLQAVEGSTWTMSLPLSTIGFSAPRPIAPAHVEAVRAALAGDATFVPDPVTVDTDPYFGGKQLAKLARLALIADELGEAATASALRARLRPLLTPWLDGTNGNPFVYDMTWGGVVTTQGLANPSAEFGAGHYNDHHFHYGYFLYAAATLARTDPAFATTYRGGLLALVRDIANPSPNDPGFPRFRHMDFFRGHSWAAGLTDEPKGQDQESTSEAVNAWYSLQLLGLATGDVRMSDLGRVLLSLEVDAARTYWQIPLPSRIYQDPYAQNMCVGILFQTRAFFGTFFAAGPEYVYGIQMLPYTPVSENLVSPAWIGSAWPKMQTAATTATQGWNGLLYMGHAVTAREAAWAEVNTLTGYDDGNSKTNTLWWVATRP
jgi:endo-1,3(4)-beta-glucanase